MKWIYLSFAMLVVFPYLSQAQCGSEIIDQSTYVLHDIDTEETVGEGANNGNGIHAFDNNNSTFWHTKWKDHEASFPHYISIDLKNQYPITGVEILTRRDIARTKPLEYKIYLSDDGVNWKEPQAKGLFQYEDVNESGQQSEVSFGAVEARYVKLYMESSTDGGNHVAIAELWIKKIVGGEGCVATGQSNQLITFEEIGKRYASEGDVKLNTHVSSNLPISYQIISGPGTVLEDRVVLSGPGGIITVRAYNMGNDQYYPVEAFQSFRVVDTDEIVPTVESKLSDTYPIQMPELMAYPLHARAYIDEADVLEIVDMSIYINDEEIESTFLDNLVSAYWTPDSYGEYTIKMEATASNGQTNAIYRDVVVSAEIKDENILTLEKAIIDFGSIGSQWYYGTYELPQFISAYESINARFDVRCPQVSGGCDDWDRLAYVQIKDDRGEWVELFRYITPFGKGCYHETDVTDYQSLLQGTVDFRVYIETWGTGGWQMDLLLDYKEGSPSFPYTIVERAWQGKYNFGDPKNLQPVPIRTFTPPVATDEIEFRLTTTGHGWGQNNSFNAAEFYYAKHNLKVNGQHTYTQDMRVDCNPNPDGCNNQAGTWQYDRAGWCPGTIPKPYIYNLTDYKEEPFTFQYEFEPSYVDRCHPNNEDCVSGITCPDCNDGYNPYYQVGAYMIYKSEEPIHQEIRVEVQESVLEMLKVFPNPTQDEFKIVVGDNLSDFIVEIKDVTGRGLKRYYFKDNDDIIEYRFTTSTLTSGIYFIHIYDQTRSIAKKLIIEK